MERPPSPLTTFHSSQIGMSLQCDKCNGNCVSNYTSIAPSVPTPSKTRFDGNSSGAGGVDETAIPQLLTDCECTDTQYWEWSCAGPESVSLKIRDWKFRRVVGNDWGQSAAASRWKVSPGRQRALYLRRRRPHANQATTESFWILCLRIRLYLRSILIHAPLCCHVICLWSRSLVSSCWSARCSLKWKAV